MNQTDDMAVESVAMAAFNAMMDRDGLFFMLNRIANRIDELHAESVAKEIALETDSVVTEEP